MGEDRRWGVSKAPPAMACVHRPQSAIVRVAERWMGGGKEMAVIGRASFQGGGVAAEGVGVGDRRRSY